MEISWERNYKHLQKHIRAYFRALDRFGKAKEPTKELYDNFLKRERLLKAMGGYKGV